MRRYPFEMFDEMERMFEGMRRSMLDGPDWAGEQTHLRLEETDEGYRVLADLPGFEREELDVAFDEGVLHVSADHEVTDERTARSRHVSESIRVPGDVLVEDITASYRNGVLEVTLPTDGEDTSGYHIDVE